MKLNYRLVYFILMFILLTGCTNKPEVANESSNQLYTKIYVGITPGIHYTILKKIDELVNDDGYMIVIKVYENSKKLLSAVAANDIDIAYGITVSEYNWGVYEAKTDLFLLETDLFEPFILFSLKNSWPIQEGAIVTIPRNPLDLSRVLHFLSSEGIIKLAKDKEGFYTLEDIIENPCQYQFLPYAKEDFAKTTAYADAAVVAASVAIESTLMFPEVYSMEKRTSQLYDEMLIVKKGNKDKIEIQKLKSLFSSEELKSYIYEQYQGALEIIP